MVSFSASFSFSVVYGVCLCVHVKEAAAITVYSMTVKSLWPVTFFWFPVLIICYSVLKRNQCI